MYTVARSDEASGLSGRFVVLLAGFANLPQWSEANA
jgi:hypothetical protein